MTRKRAKELLPVFTHWANGGRIQYFTKFSQKWEDDSGIGSIIAWDDVFCEYRIKPEPTYRPWTAEEVPVGALVRKSNNTLGIFKALITGVTILEIKSQFGSDTFRCVLDNWEHSLDNGKTWQPCGVAVNP